MTRGKKLLAIGLVPLLGAVAALGLVAAPTGQDLTVPSANMQLSSKWEAQPAAGEPASVPWANIQVSTNADAQNEPFVAVNPNNSRHIVVGSNGWDAGNGHFEVYAYVTFDGGQTWAVSQPYINRNAGRINAADPTIAFAADGSVYFAFIALTPADGAVAVSRSVDGGLTWSSQSWATSFTGRADKPALAAGNGKLYVFYQNSSLHGTVSADGGASWSPATRIEFAGRNAAPVIDGAGNVNVFYNTGNSIKLARMGASGRGYSIATVANAVPLQPRTAPYRAHIYPAAAADAAGNLYVAWADGRNAGMGNDIMYSRSVDGGQTWSAPVALNTDGTGADQLMPALAAGANGTVTAIWLDSRNDPANINYDVYMTTSRDGVTFNGNQRVTSVSSNPYNDARTQGKMIGDYFGLGAGNGVFYASWTDTRNNNADIYLAPIGASAND